MEISNKIVALLNSFHIVSHSTSFTRNTKMDREQIYRKLLECTFISRIEKKIARFFFIQTGHTKSSINKMTMMDKKTISFLPKCECLMIFPYVWRKKCAAMRRYMYSEWFCTGKNIRRWSDWNKIVDKKLKLVQA